MGQAGRRVKERDSWQKFFSIQQPPDRLEKIMPKYHESIMKYEVLHYLNIHMEGVIVDGTLGDGGHTESILKNTGPKTRVLGIDRDLSAIERARKRLQPFRDRVIFAHSSLENLQDIVAKSGVTKINGLVLDFGVSSPQLDTPERGFSIRHDGPLDMRMDNSQKTTAANLLEKLKDVELISIIKNFGEERVSKKNSAGHSQRTIRKTFSDDFALG